MNELIFDYSAVAMIEILLAVYISSFVASWCLIFWYLWTLRRNFKSNKLAVLNSNLSKVQMFWANSSSGFETLAEGSIERDQKKSLRSFLLVGLLLSLLSLLGFILLTCVVISLKFLARSRLEKNVFQSELTKNELETQKVFEMVTAFKSGLIPAVVAFLMLAFISSRASADEFFASSSAPHAVKLYAHGPSALKAYVAMIEEAKTSVDLETFVFVPDRAGSLILQALREKAKQHVPVRLMMDAYGSKKHFLQSDLDDLLSLGIEVRFYNVSTFHMLPIDHRKFLIIDGKKVFFGGRNLSDENFGTDAEKRRLDYSAELEGPIVSEILKSYNAYWNSSMVHTVRSEGHPQFLPSAAATELKTELSQMPTRIVGEFYPTQLEFVSDEPTNSKRLFADFLVHKISSVQQGLVIETPDFAVGNRVNKALSALLGQKKSVSLLTMESSDHSATISYSLLSLGSDLTSRGLKNKGAEVYFKRETLSPEVLPLTDPKTEDIPWGSHCKASVFDGKDVLLGSFNYDVLSEEHNSEAGIYFLNAPEMVAALRNLEASRPYQKQ